MPFSRVTPTAAIARESEVKHTCKFALILAGLTLLNGCSIRQVAITKVADTLAGGSSVYASDNDIELVGDALPFSLKTIEGLLLEVPEHKGLLLTASSGFTQYSYAYVDLHAFEIEPSDPSAGAGVESPGQEPVSARQGICPARRGAEAERTLSRG